MSFLSELAGLVNSELPFTDIRLERDAPIRLRMPGGWEIYDDIDPPDGAALGQFLSLFDEQWEQVLDKRSINRPLDLAQWRLRVNAFQGGSRSKVMCAIRRIPLIPPKLAQVGLPNVVRIWLEAQRGLILLSGATRSGKSTSAAAMIDAINDTRRAHVITIEDPIEYVFESRQSVFSQREVGVDTESLETGLEDAMRQCPDVILVGEIRNRETAETAILAGESGHLVIGTLHANSGVGTIQKMLSWFGDNERAGKMQSIANSLIGVACHMLLPTKDGDGYVLGTEILSNFDQDLSKMLSDPSALASFMDRPAAERRGSQRFVDSLCELVKNDRISDSQAMRAVAGLPGAQQQLSHLIKQVSN